jgi:LysM repeat protein
MSVSLSKLSTTALAAGAVALALSGAPQAQAQSPCGSAVTVSPGDTLYRIAQECGTTVSALARHNNIANPNRIEVGQRIAMPGRVAGGAPEQAMGLTPDDRYGDRYTVRSGDTLYATSRQFGIPVQVLLSVNPNIDPRRLRAGIDIRLPGDRPDRDRPGRRPGDDDRVTISGTVTGEGVECLAVRGDDGQLYTLAGNVDDLQPGDRVQVQGRRAEVSFCQQGTTIDVRRYRTIG